MFCSFDNGILFLLFVTNVLYGNCMYVDCNNLNFMWRYIE